MTRIIAIKHISELPKRRKRPTLKRVCKLLQKNPELYERIYLEGADLFVHKKCLEKIELHFSLAKLFGELESEHPLPIHTPPGAATIFFRNIKEIKLACKICYPPKPKRSRIPRIKLSL